MSTLPAPFYCADGITIYHSDCRPILAAMDPARVLVIADPPYGIGEETNRREKGRASLAQCNDFPLVIGDDAPFEPAHLLRFRVAIFGANHFADRLPPSPSWLTWDKRDGIASNDNADCEHAWTNCGGPARLLSHRWSGMIKASEGDQRRCHPTQKPVALAKWIISRYARPGDTIVEPYMGSGFAVVAAKQLGFPAVGCELHLPYLETVKRRLSQRVLDFGPSL